MQKISTLMRTMGSSGCCDAADDEDPQDAKGHEKQPSDAIYHASEANGHLYSPATLMRIS